MKNFKLALSAFVLISTFGQRALAGDGTEHGNGGDAIVCRDSKGKIIPIPSFYSGPMLLDYYEAKRWGGTLDLGSPDLTVRQKVQRLIARNSHDAAFTQELLVETEKLVSAIEEFEKTGLGNDDILFTDETLPDLPDAGMISFPSGCGIEQVVIRYSAKQKKFQGGFEYKIQKEIWAAFNNDQRAGTILHEAIWKRARELNHPHDDSIPSREFNRWYAGYTRFAHVKISKSSFQEYVNMLRELGFNGPALTISADSFADTDSLVMRVSFGEKPNESPFCSYTLKVLKTNRGKTEVVHESMRGTDTTSQFDYPFLGGQLKGALVQLNYTCGNADLVKQYSATKSKVELVNLRTGEALYSREEKQRFLENEHTIQSSQEFQVGIND